MTAQSAGVNLIDRQGAMHPVTAQGWDALLKKEQN